MWTAIGRVGVIRRSNPMAKLWADCGYAGLGSVNSPTVPYKVLMRLRKDMDQCVGLVKIRRLYGVIQQLVRWE